VEIARFVPIRQYCDSLSVDLVKKRAYRPKLVISVSYAILSTPDRRNALQHARFE
jgi:hypothetical protein